MKQRDELNLILELLRRYNLPLSPILEYAIKEKLEKLETSSKEESIKEFHKDTIVEVDSNNGQSDAMKELQGGDFIPNESIIIKRPLSVVDYGSRSIVVIGDTKPFKDTFKKNGGYFTPRTQYGPGWIFTIKKRKEIEKIVNQINNSCKLASVELPKEQDNVVIDNTNNNTVPSITPSAFSNYISTLEKSNGGYYTNSSIQVYTSSLISKYMKSKVEKYDSSGNLYNIKDLDVLAKLADDILQDIKIHKISNSYLIALKLYIQFLNEKKILTNI